LQLQYHISKISWTFADKILYVIYGFVLLLQISIMAPSDFALFNFLLALNTWIFVISDSFALQSVIQYGFDLLNRRKVNTYSVLLHLIIVIVLSGALYALQGIITNLLDEPRFLEITPYLPLLSLFMIPRTYCLKLMLRDHKMNRIFMTNLAFFGWMVFKVFQFKFSENSINLNDAIYIYLEGTALSSLTSILLSLKELRFSFSGNIRIKDIISFSLPFTLTNALNTIPKYLDVFILKLFFPLEQVGVYSAARSIFKFFEEGMNGVNGLVYPAAVRAVTNKDSAALHSIVTKAVSFTLFGFIISSIFLALGMSDYLVALLGKVKFIDAIIHFKIMLIATIFLPFNILYFVITAYSKHFELMKIVGASLIFSIITYIFIGLIGENVLMPIAYVVYYAAFSIMAFRFVNKQEIVIFKSGDLFRAYPDGLEFLSKILKLK